MTIISPRKSVKLSYQQLLKAVRALPPRQQQQLREVLMPTAGVYLVRPSPFTFCFCCSTRAAHG
ncbi:MAG: hypothetical protein HZC38_15800 [Chloroflexi bacterium]|nr:hypothetical protein [Chloroflexota bacterium]